MLPLYYDDGTQGIAFELEVQCDDRDEDEAWVDEKLVMGIEVV